MSVRMRSLFVARIGISRRFSSGPVPAGASQPEEKPPLSIHLKLLPQSPAAPPRIHAVAVGRRRTPLPRLLRRHRHRHCGALSPEGDGGSPAAVGAPVAHQQRLHAPWHRAVHGEALLHPTPSAAGGFSGEQWFGGERSCHAARQDPHGKSQHHHPQVMCPDVYRGLWGGSKCRDSPVQTTRSCNCHSDTGECQAREAYLSEFRELLLSAAPLRLAGFIAEPIQGVNGVVQYPRGFLSEAANIVRARGGLYISDEVQTGFGRLGSHFWGFQSLGVTPDIITTAKGIANGFPMGAVVTTPDIAACMGEALSFNTFGGGPLACAIGSAVLQVIDEEGLMQNAEARGTDLMLQLSDLRKEFEVVGDVRGKGLMVGLELVRSKESREPLPPTDMRRIWEDCKEMGLLLGIGGIFGQTFRLKPPMCISQEDVDFAVAVLRLALQRHTLRKSGEV
ncbi:alanine--glyoxylate aminotransferase 2, mitochondrial isoform X8 [Mobula birostris]|uniref:alanine--glyoxylate aminotransferase 2, mitochondrial isoform X8 n=1 Tax=Mobula birostris TaxID=1983395 RepID=UPI003B28B63A